MSDEQPAHPPDVEDPAGTGDGHDDPRGADEDRADDHPDAAWQQCDDEPAGGQDVNLIVGGHERPASDELHWTAGQRDANLQVTGTLWLHYPSRDVAVPFPVDGDTAIRALTMFARRGERRLADTLTATDSSATSSWVVFDLDEPLAMSWTPDTDRRQARTALDPPAA